MNRLHSKAGVRRFILHLPTDMAHLNLFIKTCKDRGISEGDAMASMIEEFTGYVPVTDLPKMRIAMDAE